MKSSSPAAVIAVGLAGTLIFGMGLATFVTQNVVALSQEEDDGRNGGFDLKDWCAIVLNGDFLTIKAEGVTLEIDVADARGSFGRPTATGTPGTTDGPEGHLVSVRGAVDDGAWVAHVMNVKRQRCDLETGEPIDRADRTLTPGTPEATRTPRPTRTPREEITRTPGRPETRTPRPTRTPRAESTRTPGRPTDAPGRGPDGNQGQGQGGGQDNNTSNRGRGPN